MTIGRFTDDLLFSSGEKWDRVVNHRFTKELAAGTIDRKVLARYLIQDFRFLDAFIILLATVICNARSLEDRIPGCQFLAHISGAENTYFERCFQKLLGDSHEKHRNEIPNHDCTSKFINLMVDVSRKGSLGYVIEKKRRFYISIIYYYHFLVTFILLISLSYVFILFYHIFYTDKC